MVMIQVGESLFQMVPAQCSFHSWRAGFRYQMTCTVYSITALRFYKIVDFIFTMRQLLTVVNDYEVWSMSFYNQLPVDGLIYFACQTAVNDAPSIPKVDAHIESSASYNYFFYCLLRSARSFSFILGQLTEWKIPIMKFLILLSQQAKWHVFQLEEEQVDHRWYIIKSVVSPFSLTSSTNQSTLFIYIILLYFPDRNPDVWSVRTNEDLKDIFI